MTKESNTSYIEKAIVCLENQIDKIIMSMVSHEEIEFNDKNYNTIDSNMTSYELGNYVGNHFEFELKDIHNYEIP